VSCPANSHSIAGSNLNGVEDCICDSGYEGSAGSCTACAADTYSALTCPDGYTEFNGDCWGHSDTLGLAEMGCPDAEDYCVSVGGHLATISSSLEQDFVVQLRESANSGSPLWIGLNTFNNGNLEWFDGSSVEYTFWKSGEPDANQNSDTCVALSLSSALDPTGRWEDWAIIDYLEPFICRISKSSTCASCPANTHSPVGSDGIEDCTITECAAGDYLDVAGGAGCVSCPANSHSIAGSNLNGVEDCICDSGYEGSAGSCTDADECALRTDNCQAEADCTNTAGSFTCGCNLGYSGDGVICTDNDECALGTDNCQAEAACTNTAGSFTCGCSLGYSGDGVSCADIDECAQNTPATTPPASYSETCDETQSNNCHPLAFCSATLLGDYQCYCPEGYCGDGVGGSGCETCNNCDDYAACTNTAGSFTCACLPGFAGRGDDGSCFNADECTDGTHNCHADAICSDTTGSFTCACKASEGGREGGSSLSYEGDGVTCVAVCDAGTIGIGSQPANETGCPERTLVVRFRSIPDPVCTTLQIGSTCTFPEDKLEYTCSATSGASSLCDQEFQGVQRLCSEGQTVIHSAEVERVRDSLEYELDEAAFEGMAVALKLNASLFPISPRLEVVVDRANLDSQWLCGGEPTGAFFEIKGPATVFGLLYMGFSTILTMGGESLLDSGEAVAKKDVTRLFLLGLDAVSEVVGGAFFVGGVQTVQISKGNKIEGCVLHGEYDGVDFHLKEPCGGIETMHRIGMQMKTLCQETTIMTLPALIIGVLDIVIGFAIVAYGLRLRVLKKRAQGAEKDGNRQDGERSSLVGVSAVVAVGEAPATQV